MPAHQGFVGESASALDAAMLHGRDPSALSELRDLCAASIAARLLIVPDVARRAGLDAEVIDEVEALVHAVVEQPAAWLRAILEEPLVRVWLVDVEVAIRRGDRQANELLSRLVWLCAAHLDRLVPEVRRWHTALPVNGRCSPLGADVVVLADTVQMSELTVEPGLVTIAGDPGITLEVTGERLRVVDAVGVRQQLRRRTVFGIELLDVADFPELGRVDVDTGRPLPSPSADVDAPLSRAMDLIFTVWPEALVDVTASIRAIVPLVAPRGHVYNTSSGSAPGVVQLTIREAEDPLILAETVVHEAAHLKLDALWDVAPFLDSPGGPLIRHPWLDAPRPLRGALLGAQAFLNVAEFDRRAASKGVDPPYTGAQHRLHVEEVRAVLEMVGEDRSLTAMGAAVVSALRTTLDGIDVETAVIPSPGHDS